MKKTVCCILCINISFVFLLSSCSNPIESSESSYVVSVDASSEPSEVTSEETSFVFEDISVDFPTETVTKSPEIGDVFEFGCYPQGEGGTVLPIKWLILDIQDGQALVLSKYGLACKPFDETGEYNTWEDCSLRSWLNEEFYNDAFSEAEQSLIIESTISTATDSDGHEHYDTLDNVFVLSMYEATHYLKKAYSRCCDPTDYIIDDINAYCYYSFLENSPSRAGVFFPGCSWWLRSPGEYNSASIINHDGKLSSASVRDRDTSYDVDGELVSDNYRSSVVVRPALWINLDSITQTVYSDEQLADDTSVVINEVNFPDENLRNIISERFDEDSNGILVFQEIQSIVFLDVRDTEINSLKGIENFRYLKRIDVSSNHLTDTLDMSGLYLLETFIMEKNKTDNSISLVFGNNPNLRFLLLSGSNVESLDIMSCSNLELLNCDSNNLTELNVSNCTHLKKLFCFNNYICNIELSGNSELIILAYNGSWMYTSSEGKGNKVTKLDLSHCSKLKSVYVANCNLEELNISGCNDLSLLDVAGNQGIMSKITYSNFNNLHELRCDNTGLKSIDIRTFPNLKRLCCSNNEITELNISGTSIDELDCSSNVITSLTLNSTIWELDCHNNQLDYLDLSCLEHTLILYCYNNGPLTVDLGDLETFYSGADSWNEEQKASYNYFEDNTMVYVVCEYVWLEVTSGEIHVDTDVKFTY